MVPGLACMACALLFWWTLRGWHTSAETCRSLILYINFILPVLSAFFGRYIDFKNMHGMSLKKVTDVH